MAGRKRVGQGGKPRSGGGNSLAHLGLLDMPDITGLGQIEDDDSDDDEASLEAELQAIVSGKAPSRIKRKPKKAMGLADIDNLASECLADTPSDEDKDENLSGDEDLVAELEEISGSRNVQIHQKEVLPVPPPRNTSRTDSSAPPKSDNSVLNVLNERYKAYQEAEAACKLAGDSSKVRRYNRAIKNLESLIQSAKAGKPIDEEEIPPPVVVPKPKDSPRVSAPPVQPDILNSVTKNEMPSPPPPAVPAPVVPPSRPEHQPQPVPVDKYAGKDPTYVMLCTRRDQYKASALQSKRNGDNASALKYVKIAKQFDTVIHAFEEGQAVDLSGMPPPPPGYNGTVNSALQQASSNSQSENKASGTNISLANQMLESNEPEDPSLFNAPPPPSSISEALQQRLEKFQSTMAEAKEQGNSGKVRRLGRIVKQYEDAIKCHKAGKPVPFDELPAPPGFAPIPSEGLQPPPAPARTAQPVQPSQPQSTVNNQSENSQPIRTAPAPPKPGAKRKPLQRNPSSVLDKNLAFLLERQRLFKQAALESKKRGEIEQAKEYLRMSKGLDPMIEATRCGLPINAASIPTPPQLQEDFVIVDKTECVRTECDDKNKEELFRSLERDLTRQLEMCLRNKDHFLGIGDVSSAFKFEKLAQDTGKDMLVVQNSWRQNHPAPWFHYETRLFSMVQCHTDLTVDELEVTIQRGINLRGKPNDLDSYVKIEFPFPNDNPQKLRSQTVKDTNNPVYSFTLKLQINRKSRQLVRSFKKGIKLEVWSKGGFLRSDSLLGTATIKLADLDTKCTIHDSFDVLEGRKASGGKLEVKVRIREPLLAKQVEEVKERWLVIGS